MESKSIKIAIVVVLLGIAAAVAGFVAEVTKVTKSDLIVVDYEELDPECEYPSSPATGLAIAAVVALVIARAIITSATGGCQPLPNLSKFARVCLIISWIISSISVILFVAGATLSNKKGAVMDGDGTFYCYTLRSGIFLGAGIMGLVSMFLAATYYLYYVYAKSGNTSLAEVEIEAPPIRDSNKTRMANEK